jgi:acyl-CoA synthetase (NDP forming)
MKLSDSLSLLSRHGIQASGKPVTLEEALEIPRPIVLKGDIEGHKTDEGMVFVGLKTEGEIRSAYEKIAKKHDVFGQPVVKGFEFAVGAVEDPSFGKVVMFGLGGVYAELFRDASFRAVPLTEKDAQDMISETGVSKVFAGFRGEKPSESAVVDVLLKLSGICEEVDFKEIDVNPLMVDGNKALAVDARVIL